MTKRKKKRRSSPLILFDRCQLFNQLPASQQPSGDAMTAVPVLLSGAI